MVVFFFNLYCRWKLLPLNYEDYYQWQTNDNFNTIVVILQYWVSNNESNESNQNTNYSTYKLTGLQLYQL